MDIAELDIEQARRMAQVCLDLHAALGVQWGDDPYHAISLLRAKEPGSAGPDHAGLSQKEYEAAVCAGDIDDPKLIERIVSYRRGHDEGRIEGHSAGWSACREAAAKVVDDCNDSGPYDAIGAASLIRAIQPPKE